MKVWAVQTGHISRNVVEGTRQILGLKFMFLSFYYLILRRLNIYYPHFNHTLWPACQEEFKKIWGKDEVFAHNAPSRE